MKVPRFKFFIYAVTGIGLVGFLFALLVVSRTYGQAGSPTTVNFGTLHALSLGTPHTHSGIAVSDVDGLNSYAWTWIACPTFPSCPSLSGPTFGFWSGQPNVTIAAPRFVPADVGTYTLELLVTDMAGNIGSFNLTETVGVTIPASLGVTVTSDGYLEGYAWANPYDDVADTPNFGWIRFDLPDAELQTCPLAASNGCDSARLDRNTGVVNGWVRFCAVYANGCEGPLANNIYRGGWDGWIRLSGGGVGVSHETRIVGCTWEGWAWGGPDVVGWISFSSANPGHSGSAPYGTFGGCPDAALLVIEPSQARLVLGGISSQQFVAKYDADGSGGLFAPTDVTTSTSIIWSTSNPSVATVVPTGNGAGFVQAAAIGSAVISAVYTDSSGGSPITASSTAVVYVEPPRIIEVQPEE